MYIVQDNKTLSFLMAKLNFLNVITFKIATLNQIINF